MTFINTIQTILRKSNGNILNFYVRDKVLFYREFIFKQGWQSPKEFIEDVEHNQLDIKIDSNDKVYGIVHVKSGEVIYLYTKNNIIYKEKLFEYDTGKYTIKYPYIQKNDSDIHVLYYLQDVTDNKTWGIINHYYNGVSWTQNDIAIIKSYPILNPFVVSSKDKNISLFYLDKMNDGEEIFTMSFDTSFGTWSKPQQITATNNKKLYLNALNKDLTSHYITWSEFIDNNLVVRHMKYSYKDDILDTSEIKLLSQPSNCSFPTMLLTGDTLWNVWVKMNKLVSCYSFNHGETWSSPKVNITSTKVDFIRYKFSSNSKDDLTNFKVNSVFGSYYPKISFIGFENFQTRT